MMGIPCDFPAYVYGDKHSVLVNSLKYFSMMKKKSSSIDYHFSVKELPTTNGEALTFLLMIMLLIF